jgi:hypothetical protein
MKKMKVFVDTHDKHSGSFPEHISREDFAAVFNRYQSAADEEGVVVMQAMVNAEAGRMFCINFASDPESVRHAHEKAGLKFDSITEVTTASPGDLYFQWK